MTKEATKTRKEIDRMIRQPQAPEISKQRRGLFASVTEHATSITMAIMFYPLAAYYLYRNPAEAIDFDAVWLFVTAPMCGAVFELESEEADRKRKAKLLRKEE